MTRLWRTAAKMSTTKNLGCYIVPENMAIFTWLLKVRRALHKYAESARKTEQRKRNYEMEGKGEPLEVQAVVSLDEKTLAKITTKDKSPDPIQVSIKNATWAAFYAVVAYAIVTTLMWCAMIEQNKIGRENLSQATDAFRTDERAWMGFKFAEGNLNLTFNKSFLVPTELTNTGKTPAKDINGDIVVGVFKDGEPLEFSYTAGGKHPFYHISAGTMFPNGKVVESFEAEQHGAVKPEPIIFTPALKDELFPARKSYIIIYGKITYQDIFGVDHWTTYCRYVLHPELISEECMKYNDADNNKAKTN